MLAQLVALLTLGVLCSSAPMPAPGATNAVRLRRQDECSGGSIIKEILENVKKGKVSLGQGFSAVPLDPKNCMHDSLRVFKESLKANETNSIIFTQLSRLYECKNLFSKDLGKKCKTAKVSSQEFMEMFETFLKFLNGEI